MTEREKERERRNRWKQTELDFDLGEREMGLARAVEVTAKSFSIAFLSIYL